MKKAIGFILSAIIVISCFPFVVFAAEPEVISGSSASLFCDGADSVSIGGINASVGSDVDFEVNFFASDASSAYSFIYLNNKQIAPLVNGENVIKLNTKDLAEGDNELKIVLGVSNKTYNFTDVYGTYNIDDVTFESVRFNGLGFDKPAKMKLYMPKVGAAGVTVQLADYSDGILVGDGWFQDTGLGGSTPETPVMIGYVFRKPELSDAFIVDTTKMNDGKQVAVFSKDGKTVSEKEYIVDNTAPKIEFSVANGGYVSRLDKITYKTNDITSVDSALYLDGKEVSDIYAKNLSLGNHVAYVIATDAVGNTSRTTVNFNVTNKLYNISVKDDELTMSVLGDASLYSAELLKDIRMYENRYGEFDQDYLRSSDEVLVSFNNKAELVTKAIGDSVPYQSFVINTSKAKGEDVLVSYTGTTGNGSGIVLKAWNYKDSCWDIIGKTESGVPVTVSANIEKYTYKNRMRVNVAPDLVYNGSNTIIWNSDTQYYSRFDDLNEFYYKICEYTVEEYKAGNIGYYVHTGDLIDQAHMGDEIAHYEYQVADKAQDILDDANVPNGVVSGNHDICHESADYSYYWQYFGEDRYKDFDWYGGSLNNNMHHYDLVSIGAHDFVFLYIGNYKEVEDDTVNWAKSVCDAYPNRNVIVCTHEYLLPSGEFSSDRSKEMWEKIIVPNENIIMVLCGHNEGVCDQMRRVGDSDRYVLEILADYQFSELGVGPQHVLNDCTCDGEGFVRLMSFNEAGQVITNTYSPVAEDYGVYPYNFFPSYADSFVYDLKMVPSGRSICTSEFNVVYESEHIGKVGDKGISLEKYEAFYAEIERGGETYLSEVYVLDEYKVNYIPALRNKYTEPEYEKTLTTGYANVNENFRMNEKNKRPTDSFIDVGLELLPTDAGKLIYASGNTDYTTAVNENGGITLSHSETGDSNWVTLTYEPNGKSGVNIDTSEYDRIYFGVTADKNTKWNASLVFIGPEVNFARTKEVASMFGYVNALPSDITGTWNGYIDLEELGITGNKTVLGIHLVSATPGEEITFDYFFLGKSEGQKVRFITDEKTIVSFEGKVGDKIELIDDPFKVGYTFDGWYTKQEGGEKIDGPITVKNDTVEVFARFTKKASSARDVETFNEEINIQLYSALKVILVVAVIIIVVAVIVIVLLVKKKKKKDKAK